MALAIALTLVSAGLHATWNVLLKASADPLRLSARAMGAGTLLLTPAAVVAWVVSGRPALQPLAWGLAGLSAVAELAYFVFLSLAYRRGELSAVYPIARGTAPVLAVGVGLLLLAERPALLQLVGVSAVLAGIWAVRRPAPAARALVPALLTGVCIGTYTSLDRVGVRLGPPWLYAWLVSALTAVLLTGWLALFGSRQPESDVPGWPLSALVGLLMSVTYLLVLFALSIAPLSVIAPLRESAIVLVSAWGVWRLHEREGVKLKVAGAAAVLAGVVLIAAG